MLEPDLLMVPGLGLTSEAWEPTVRSLLREGVGAPSVSVATLPGYGEPLRPGDPIAPADAARRLLDTSILPGRQYLLLGHSSSCQVVAHAAALAPERVAGLVLVGPTTDPRAATWPRLARRWLANAAHETPRQIPRVQRQYRRTTFRAMGRIMDAARRDRIDRTLEAVTCPVRIVRGPHDRIVPEDWCQGLASTVTLPRGAHMLPITHHDLLAREVLSHLGFVQSRT